MTENSSRPSGEMNDCNSPADSQRLSGAGELNTTTKYEETHVSSGDSGSAEDLDPHDMVEKMGLEMKSAFLTWIPEFESSKEVEDDMMKRLDDIKNRAYALEIEFLENKIEVLKKKIN